MTAIERLVLGLLSTAFTPQVALPPASRFLWKKQE
jgi:hypothetical protein